MPWGRRVPGRARSSQTAVWWVSSSQGGGPGEMGQAWQATVQKPASPLGWALSKGGPWPGHAVRGLGTAGSPTKCGQAGNEKQPGADCCPVWEPQATYSYSHLCELGEIKSSPSVTLPPFKCPLATCGSCSYSGHHRCGTFYHHRKFC